MASSIRSRVPLSEYTSSSTLTGARLALWAALLVSLYLVYSFVRPFDPHSFDPETISENVLAGAEQGSAVTQVVLVACSAACLPLALYHRDRLLALLRSAWPLLLFTLWVACSAMWSDNPDLTIRRTIRFALFLWIASATTASMGSVRLFANSIISAITIVIFIDMLSIVLTPYHGMTIDGFAGIHEGKNDAGSVLGIAIIAFGGAAMASKSFTYKCGWLIMLVSSLILLYLSECKTCFGIGIMIPVGCIISYFGYRRVPYFPLLALGMAAMFVGFAPGLIAITGSSTDDVLQLLFGDPTLTGRTDIWALVIERIEQRPLLGYGWMAFWGALQANPLADVPLTSWISSVYYLNSGHNGYLDLTLEAGFIGLALTILIICRALWIYGKLLRLPWLDYRQPRLVATLLGIVLCLLVNNAMESLLFRSGGYLSELFIFIYLAGESQYLLNESGVHRHLKT